MSTIIIYVIMFSKECCHRHYISRSLLLLLNLLLLIRLIIGHVKQYATMRDHFCGLVNSEQVVLGAQRLPYIIFEQSIPEYSMRTQIQISLRTYITVVRNRRPSRRHLCLMCVPAQLPYEYSLSLATTFVSRHCLLYTSRCV